MSTVVSAADVLSALKIVSAFDFKGAIAAFESQDTQTKVVEGAIALDDMLKIVGIFVPPVAIVANDIEVGIEVEKIALPLVQMLLALPVFKTPAGTRTSFTAFNEPFTGALFQG